VPAELGGRGIGKRLVQATLDLIRSRGEKIEAICPFVVAWMKRHPEYDDLRA
jgi:predicted GNAT family acetyltransferase